MFDKDRSGFVGKGQIKYILTNLGEKMSEEEVEELFKSTIDTGNNEVDYRGMFIFDLFAFFLALENGLLTLWQNSSRRLRRTEVLVWKMGTGVVQFGM